MDARPTPIDAWLAGRDPSQLDVLERDGRTLYPETIRRKGRKGDPAAIVEVAILLRTPSTADKALARLDALKWAQELLTQSGAKQQDRLTVAAAEAVIGVTYFDELDTKCLLARCMFEAKPPHDPYLLPQMLDARHDSASLEEVWTKLNFYVEWEDPRVGELEEEQFLALVAAIDRVRNISPLAAIAGSARASCIVTMAARLQSCLAGSSFWPSTETSTP